MHQAIMDTNKNGHTSTVDGHSHEIKKGKITMTCPPGIGCHSHNL